MQRFSVRWGEFSRAEKHDDVFVHDFGAWQQALLPFVCARDVLVMVNLSSTTSFT